MAAQGIVYRQMRPGEEAMVSELMVRSFDEFIGASYPRAGVRDFLSYVSTPAILDRLRRQHTVLVALDGARIVGVVDIDDYRHIDLLFVEKALPRKGHRPRARAALHRARPGGAARSQGAYRRHLRIRPACL